MARMTRLMVFVSLFFISSGDFAPADDSGAAVDAPIVEARLFKNGLAMVTRSFSAAREGDYLIRDVPRPVHGTLWIEGRTDATVRFTEEAVSEKPLVFDRRVLMENLVGKVVEMALGDDKVLTGKVLGVTEKPEKHFSDRYGEAYRGYYGYRSSLNPPGSQAGPSQVHYIVLSTKQGITVVDFNRVTGFSYLEDGEGLSTEVHRPMMRVSVPSGAGKQAVRFSYLTKGLSWAPSYRLDLSDEGQGSLMLKAVIKNELMDLENARVYLISGYPAIRFEHVGSPVDLSTPWSTFFQQLSTQPRSSRGGQFAATQQVRMNMPAPTMGFGPMPEFLSDGYDIHFQDAGKMNLDRSEALLLPVARERVGFKRIINWIVPDLRNENGRYRSSHEINADPDKYQDAIWDAVRMKNPFRFPMTTAPMAVYQGGRFHSQTLSFWTAPDETTVINVAKALNIRAKHSEKEVEGKRERVYIMGNDYQESLVEGQLFIRNYRNKTEHLVITRSFSGQLISAEGNPRKELRSEGVYSVNEKNELVWEMDVAPGQEVTLKYQYKVMVDV